MDDRACQALRKNSQPDRLHRSRITFMLSEISKLMKIISTLFCIAFIVGVSNGQKVIRYDLTIDKKMVNYSDKMKSALAINGQIPAPTLEFTEGDIAEIHVKNNLDEESSLHWHGILLPNEQDGVPYLTTTPIAAKGTHVFRFPIIQSGTYWYHSHSNLQEQKGLYGAFVINKRDEQQIPTYTVLFSDWTDEPPHEVMRNLKNANDWYAIKKNAVQSYGEAIKAGAFREKLKQEWSRMNAMDVSDVYYDAFLANGKKEDVVPQFKAGDKVRLRTDQRIGTTHGVFLRYRGQ